jgi:6-phosphogluconolactonase (cycloisomerase 2 family)
VSRRSFLYAANRLHDAIASFSVDQTGALTLVGEEWTRGDYPPRWAAPP